MVSEGVGQQGSAHATHRSTCSDETPARTPSRTVYGWHAGQK
jgi:hypothetical protein